MSISIKYIFSIGYSCNAGGFLKNYNLRQMSSPFDWMLIDFNSALKIVNSDFKDYLNDFVICHQSTNRLELVRSKNHTEIPNSIKNIFDKYVYYMSFNYKDITNFINLNYISEDVSCNIYDWNSICNFIHHDFTNEYYVNTIQNRVNRFLSIYKSYPNETILFYLTKIETVLDIEETYTKYMNMIETNNIQSYVVIIICSDTVLDSHKMIDKCLFIMKKVDSYEIQLATGGTENTKNISFDNEHRIIREYFSCENLISYSEAENNW